VTRASIIVQLRSGRTVAGILLAEYDDTISLARARVEDGRGGGLVPIDGEILIPIAQIEYAQVGVKIDDSDALPRVTMEAV
jgi:hypothetical protein